MSAPKLKEPPLGKPNRNAAYAMPFWPLTVGLPVAVAL